VGVGVGGGRATKRPKNCKIIALLSFFQWERGNGKKTEKSIL